MSKYGFLYMRYNRDHYYWELVVMARKLVLVLIGIFYNNSGQKQAQWSIGVLVVSLYAHLYVKPFMSLQALRQRKKRCKDMSANDKLEAGVLFSSVLLLLVLAQSWEVEAISGLMITVVVFALLYISIVILQAYIDQEREERALKDEGLYDDTQRGFNMMADAFG